MKLFDIFKNINSKNSNHEILKTRVTDEFADSVQLELKSVAAEAIKLALEERENKYMRSILDESYFLLDSLVIIPKDREIAKRFDDFLVTHESVDENFKNYFFQKILQKEYRSQRGGVVHIAANFSPTVQLGQSALDNLTQEEGFQVSMKGRRISFEAQANLSGPFKKEKSSQQFSSPNQVDSDYSNKSKLADFKYDHKDLNTNLNFSKVNIKIFDTNGITVHQSITPVLLGREPSLNNPLNTDTSLLRIDSRYVSRQQLVLVNIFGDCFYYVPEQASLTCMRADGSILEKMKLYKLSTDHAETLNLGIDSSKNNSPSRPEGSSSDYAVIDLSLTEAEPHLNPTGTPRPRAVP